MRGQTTPTLPSPWPGEGFMECVLPSAWGTRLQFNDALQ
jgi:hypothetical protein